jgi:hypothetical protein
MKTSPATDAVAAIQIIYGKWLAAELATEDALFQIADLVQGARLASAADIDGASGS